MLRMRAWAAAAGAAAGVGAAAGPPNFLFLLADDLGYGDVDICPEDVPWEVCPLRPRPGDRARALHLKTPRLKQFASEGAILTNWYAPRAICSPSRAALLSGRDPVRYGSINEFVRIFPSSGSRGGFPQSEKTTAEYLKDLGYSTGYSGKWHLGLNNGTDEFAYAAWNHGFDEVEYFLEGSNGEPCEKGMNPDGDDNIYHMCSFSHVLRKPGEIIEQPIRWENSTARELVSTLEFISRHANDEKPWFFMHAFTGVHVPWKLNRAFVSDPVNKHWTDMVRELDWAVGVLSDHLKATGQEDNTVVVFTSDNGPYLEFASTFCPTNCRLMNYSWTGPHGYGCAICHPGGVSSAGPLAGGKGQTWEGGVRVPGIWRWPGHIPAASINAVVSGSLDFLPTAVSLAGGEVDNDITLDGRDLSSKLLDPETYWPRRSEPEGNFIYWCGEKMMAIRMGRFKVLWHGQKWVGSDLKTEVPADHCGGSGQCCTGSPTRLCTCAANHNYASEAEFPELKGRPLVLDLVKTPGEEYAMREDPDSKAIQDLVATAEAMRLATLRSVAIERGVDPAGEPDDIEKKLRFSPDLMAVDFCSNAEIKLPTGGVIEKCPSPLIPPKMQLPAFRPYENCVNPGPGDPCRKRFPCCQQEGYPGPFEYVVEDEDGQVKKCGCFKQPAGHSLFPETALLNGSSIRKWQLLAVHGDTWTNPKKGLCWANDTTAENLERCASVAKYTLNTIPTGELWNDPYLPPVEEGRLHMELI